MEQETKYRAALLGLILIGIGMVTENESLAVPAISLGLMPILLYINDKWGG